MGRWEGARQRQPLPSSPKAPTALDPVLTLGHGSWVMFHWDILPLTAPQELSCLWSSPGTLLVAAKVTPWKWMGTRCYLWGNQILHPRARLGLGQPHQGIHKLLVSAKRMRGGS